MLFKMRSELQQWVRWTGQWQPRQEADSLMVFALTPELSLSATRDAKLSSEEKV